MKTQIERKLKTFRIDWEDEFDNNRLKNYYIKKDIIWISSAPYIL